MLRRLAGFIFRIWGWKILGSLPDGIEKFVLVIAPHTSLYDFVLGRLTLTSLGLKVKFLIKKEFFFFPLGPLLKYWGGIPVDRGKNKNIILQVAALYRKYDKLIIAITPEGTRKLTKNWKKGFYYLAKKANVPLILGYLDYGKKEAGVGPLFYTGVDVNKDFAFMEDFYKRRTARFPENFNLSPMYLDKPD